MAVDATFGGRSMPGINISVGKSVADVDAIKRALSEMTRVMDEVKRSADAAAAAVNKIKAPTGAAVPKPRAERPPKLPKPPERNIFSGTGVASGMSLTQVEAVYRRQQEMRQHMLLGGELPTTAERRELSRTSQARNVMRGLEGKDTQSMIGKLVNAAGWAPFMPQSTYLMQMMMGEMGLGLPMGVVGGVLGVGALGAAGLATNAMLVSQNRTGEQMAAQLGTTPTFTTGGAVTGQLATLAGLYHLTGTQPTDIAGALVGGGLGRSDAMGDAFGQVAVLVNTFGLSIKDATDLVSKQYTDLGKTTQEVTQDLAGMAQVALATGLPAGSIAAILQGAPDLQATVGGTAAGRAAAVFRAVYGSNALATQMAQVANVHGTQAAALAGILGYPSLEAFDQARGTTQGQGQVADQLDALARRAVAQAGPEVGFSVFNSMLAAAGGQPVSYDDFQRLLGQAPNAGAVQAAKIAAATVPSKPGVPNGADAGLYAIASGKLATAAAESQPWNVKDMAVNAGQVIIAGIGNQLGSLGTVLSGQAPGDVLNKIAAGGGIAGEGANVGLALGGDWAAAARAALDTAGTIAAVGAGTAFGPAAGLALGGAVDQSVQAVEHFLRLDVTVRPSGTTTKTITTPLPNSGQQANNYVPAGWGTQ